MVILCLALGATACTSATPASPATDHAFAAPVLGIEADAEGTVHVATSLTVGRIDADGSYTELINQSESDGVTFGDLALDANGVPLVYVSGARHGIERVTEDGLEPVVLGSFIDLEGQVFGDGSNPLYGFDVSDQGTVYIAGGSAHVVWKVGDDGALTAVAGSGSAVMSEDGSDPMAVGMPFPMDVVALSDGSFAVFHLGEAGSQETLIVRLVKSDGSVSTLFNSRDFGFARSLSLLTWRPPASLLATDGEYLYLAGGVSIARIALDGSTTEILAGDERVDDLGTDVVAADTYQVQGNFVVVGSAPGALLVGEQSAGRGNQVVKVEDGEVTLVAGS